MPKNLVELAHVIAEATGTPVPTAQLVARHGREAGLLSSGGRGRNVPKATAEDAAYILIALLGSPSPARAVEYMRGFGDLVHLPWWETEIHEETPEIVRKKITPGTTFLSGIANVLRIFGDREFARSFDIRFYELNASFGNRELPIDEKVGIILPDVRIGIRNNDLHGYISFDRSRFIFGHRVHEVLVNEGKNDENIFDAALSEAQAATRPFLSKIKSDRRIEIDALLPIAEAVCGKSFLDLLIETRSTIDEEGLSVLSSGVA